MQPKARVPGRRIDSRPACPFPQYHLSGGRATSRSRHFSFAWPFRSPRRNLLLVLLPAPARPSDFERGTYHFPGGTIPDGQTTSSTWTVTPGSRGLIIGPKLELKLPGNFSLEADALHRALHSTTSMTEFYSGGSQTNYGSYTPTHASWESPVRGKCRFRWPPLHPFLEAGPSMRPAGSGTNVSHLGVTGGAGIEF